MGQAADMHLVSDCGGLVSQIALAIPAAFFEKAQAGDWFRPLVPIGNLLAALPANVEAILLMDQASLTKGRSWIDALDLKCTVILVPGSKASEVVSTPWVQDAFLVRKRVRDGDTAVEILAPEDCGLGRQFAAFLRTSIGSLPFHLPGGNQLVGPDFRLLGHSSILSGGLGAATGPLMWTLERLEALDERPIRVFGYHPGDLSENLTANNLSQAASIRGSADDRQLVSEEIEYLARGGHQFGFHVDQFVSVTGLQRNGRPLLLLGEPCSADSRSNPLIENARRQLNASAVSLRRQGFEVLRNPVPYVVAPDSGKRLPRLYNNLMLENTIRSGHNKPLVWLPQFGDVEELDKFDRMNREIWEGLDFEIMPVPGWSYFASRNGALRCLSKVINRRETVAGQI
ncbi:hypothetical protein [Rhizobium terrae]|uniref:hypothetical protein n=1 Tax=Rhizobium terrae TaxID=2171756 RepID=UPI000E3EC6A9|nr:hypothetical protein [Rhizobium terrae]